MTVRQTSLFAFQSLNDLGSKQREVYEAIKQLGEACDLDVAFFLGWPINRVTGRRNELMKAGVIYESKVARTPRTNRTVTYWKTGV